MALRNLEGDPKVKDVLSTIHEQNLKGDKVWTLVKLKKEARLTFKKSRKGGNRTKLVLSCSPALRIAVVTRERLFIGWEVVAVEDYEDVTCCS